MVIYGFDIVVNYSCSLLSAAVFEKGLEGNLSSAADHLTLWTAYCDYLRRQVSTPTIPVTRVEGVETASAGLVELRKTFKRARDNLEACESGHYL